MYLLGLRAIGYMPGEDGGCLLGLFFNYLQSNISILGHGPERRIPGE